MNFANRGWEVIGNFHSNGPSLLSKSLFDEMENHLEAPGKSSIGTRNILTSFILSMRPNAVLEIGAHIGSSTLAMGSALKANNYGMLYSLEPQDHYIAIINEGVRKAGLSEFVTPLQIFSTDSELTKHIQNKVDMIFLDANHTYSYVAKDLEVCKRLIADNGIIFLDDVGAEMSPSMCNEKRGGVRQALIDFLQNNEEFTGIFLEHPFWLNPCGMAIVCKQGFTHKPLRNQFAAKEGEVRELVTQLAAKEGEVRELVTKLANKKVMIGNILSSNSWKITKPYRMVGAWIKKKNK